MLHRSIVSKMTAEIFGGHLNPLVAITTVKSSNPSGGGRGVGFLVEKLGKNLWLAVACKHSFEEPEMLQVLFFMQNDQPTALKQIGPILKDTEQESDVAFVVLEDPSGTEKRAFLLTANDPPAHYEAQTLYNAKNESNYTRGIYSLPICPQTNTNEGDHFAFCKMSDLVPIWVKHGDQAEEKRLLSLGYFKYRVFWMASRPGNSGSPIWDDKLRLYGMNIRGNIPGVNSNMDNFLICIPRSELFRSRQKIASQLKEFLAGR